MDETDHFGLGDLFATLLWIFFISDDLEGISAFDTLAVLGGVGSDTLEEAAEFIVVRLDPDLLILGVLEELSIL